MHVRWCRKSYIQKPGQIPLRYRADLRSAMYYRERSVFANARWCSEQHLRDSCTRTSDLSYGYPSCCCVLHPRSPLFGFHVEQDPEDKLDHEVGKWTKRGRETWPAYVSRLHCGFLARQSRLGSQMRPWKCLGWLSHSEGTNGATVESMKGVNSLIRRFLSVVEVPVFGAAVLAILILGEMNFFTKQVRYETEPIASIGMFA